MPPTRSMDDASSAVDARFTGGSGGGDMGACGASCPVATPCRTGYIHCDGPIHACLESAPADDGTPCGGTHVCRGGECVECAGAGNACPTASACRTATISCTNGSPACADSGNAENGSGCGDGYVCHAGTCNHCVSGARCTLYNPCKFGVIACETGFPECVAGDNLPDGTVCGFNKVCAGGVCPI